MIDIEAEIFDEVYRKLVEVYPDIFMSSSYVNAPAAFPAVSMIEQSNVPYSGSMTNSLTENHATVMYEINIYSNLNQGRKKQAREIAAKVDEIMSGMGFVRGLFTPAPNYADGTIFRILMRYTAVVGQDHTIYRKG